MLNDVEGLSAPTLERIAMWIWDRIDNKVPGLAQIEVHRDSCHEGVHLYWGRRRRLSRAAE